jgi:hypothetical protein
MKLIIFFLFIAASCFSQQPNYQLKLNLKEGDQIIYNMPGSDKPKQVINGFGYSFINSVLIPVKKYDIKPMPLLWIDFTDTSTFRYYKNSDNGQLYIYEVIDKSFGRNNAHQDNEFKRPIFDKKTGKIIFPEGTYLDYNVSVNNAVLSGTITNYIPNSIYFIQFVSNEKSQQL